MKKGNDYNIMNSSIRVKSGAHVYNLYIADDGTLLERKKDMMNTCYRLLKAEHMNRI